MNEPLFYNNRIVAPENAIVKLNYFINLAEQGLEIHKTDKSASLTFAKELRKLLETESHNNGLMNTIKKYSNNKTFKTYSRDVHKAYVSTTGNLSYDKVGPFLSSVYSHLSMCKLVIKSLEQEPN